MNAKGNHKQKGSFLGTIIHGYRVTLTCAAFTISTGIFLAFQLKYFSTLLFYLPLNWTRWTRTRKTRFQLCLMWSLFLIFAPRYPASSYLRNDTPIPPIGRNGTFYIAANLYNSEKVLPTWTKELNLLIDHIGQQNVFVSIYESNSADATQELLGDLQRDLHERKIRNHVSINKGERIEWDSKDLLHSAQRISYMADIRNEALSPLYSMAEKGDTFTKVIFFNDVYFDWRSIVRLINTKNGDYDLACAIDFDGIGLYDTWVLRDACGRKVREVWPYFSLDPKAVENLRKGEPIEVAACWNGVAIFDASWFLPEPSSNVSPLKFRHDDECTSSECYLTSLDMHIRTKPHRPKIYVNPQVKVAYNSLNYLFRTKLEDLTSTIPWQVVWQDWVGHRLFGWFTNLIWLRNDECSIKHALGLFVKPDYCS
ncbi:hypothetical protein FA15DRAFT_620269 [Coprinopsis marcescibilis]|uniref:Capsular associated protein n=1 Tax=Coprinopsis marcescibilis TaxID=230819 RepID=A0A5C3KTS5_COPMA|nr:hypothetical protein FA15DRAFT_620269 [Coprinopsis marcescibilis]